MQQHIPQEEVRCNIINDMMKKRNVFVKPNADMLACMLRREKRGLKSNSIVPVIGEDTIVYSFCVPLVLLVLSNHGTWKWIHSAFEDGPRGMRSYMLLKNIGSLLSKMIESIARLIIPT